MSEAPQQALAEPEAVEGAVDLSPPESELLAAATDSRRRVTLGVLCDLGDLAVSDLATHVAAREESITVADVTADHRDRVFATLHHTHVPKLVDAGLVTVEEGCADSFVSPAEWISRDATFDLVDAAFSTGRTDEVVATLLGDPARLRVVEALRAADAPVALADLARTLADAEGHTPAEGAETSTAVSLHHVHLPKLADAGVITYDASARVAEFVAVPDVYDAVIGDGSPTRALDAS